MRKNPFSAIRYRVRPTLTLVLPLLLAASGWCGAPEKVAAPAVIEAGEVPAEFAQAIEAAMRLPVGEERLKAFVTVGIAWSQKEPIPAMSWASKLKRDVYKPIAPPCCTPFAEPLQ